MSVQFIGLAPLVRQETDWQREFPLLSRDLVIHEFLKFFSNKDELKRFIVSGKIKSVVVINTATKEYDIGFHRRLQTLVLQC